MSFFFTKDFHSEYEFLIEFNNMQEFLMQELKKEKHIFKNIIF